MSKGKVGVMVGGELRWKWAARDRSKPGRRKKKTDRERMMCEVGMKSRVAGKERWKKSMEEREACTEDKTGRGKR